MYLCSVLGILFAVCAVNGEIFWTSSELKNRPRGRIIGGSEIPIEAFPHQVSVSTPKKLFICGGSIIASNFVLTAGHCIDDARDGFVRAGSKSTKKWGTIHFVIEAILHEDYYVNWQTGQQPFNDIGLLKVEPDFEYGSTTAPVPLNGVHASFNTFDGELLIVSGFGRLTESGDFSEYLNAVSVPLVNWEKCHNTYLKIGVKAIMESSFCAGISEGGKDACQNDSGGAVVANGHQVGLVSYGYGCARANFPGIYINVTYYANWITGKIGERFFASNKV